MNPLKKYMPEQLRAAAIYKKSLHPSTALTEGMVDKIVYEADCFLEEAIVRAADWEVRDRENLAEFYPHLLCEPADAASDEICEEIEESLGD